MPQPPSPQPPSPSTPQLLSLASRADPLPAVRRWQEQRDAPSHKRPVQQGFAFKFQAHQTWERCTCGGECHRQVLAPPGKQGINDA
eukprot:6629917-Prymnesium_polylepis.1